MFTVGLSKKEGTCHCGCGRGYLTFLMLLGYTLLRIYYGKPLKVSGFRCIEHNRKVKGSPGSQHCLGGALDLGVPKGYTVDTWAEFCKPFFPRILTGYVHPDTKKYVKYSSHVHVDGKGFIFSLQNMADYCLKVFLYFMKRREL